MVYESQKKKIMEEAENQFGISVSLGNLNSGASIRPLIPLLGDETTSEESEKENKNIENVENMPNNDAEQQHEDSLLDLGLKASIGWLKYEKNFMLLHKLIQ